jgi:3-oxoacyl-[acyl-carrier-protein] synthase-1
MLTPVGLNANGCMHSVRSSITRLSVQPYPDRTKAWIVGGEISLSVPYARDRRLAFLAGQAFAQAWQQAGGALQRERLAPTGLVLAAPESIRPGYRFPAREFHLDDWFRRLGVASLGPCETVAGGACSSQMALRRAAEILESGAARSCAIGAADTQLHIRVTRWHEDNYRLKCAYMTDGLMPAEAASFLIVEKESIAMARGAQILARILATEVQHDEATILSDQPNVAKGLTSAVRTVLKDAAIRSSEIGFVWCDLNGESYRSREWAFVEIRLGFQTHTVLMHPADCHGDLGAASDATLLGLAAQAQVTGWAGGKPLLVFTGSEGGLRGATVVGPPPKSSTSVRQVTERIPRVLATDIQVPPLGSDDLNYAETDDSLKMYFEWHLRQEHLESLGSLYYQRRSVLLDPTVPWIRVQEPEQRILNHIDAALAGGVTSAWTVISGINSDDEGSCFAGALMLATLPNERNFAQLDAVVAESEATNLAGIEAGLKQAPASQILQATTNAWLEHQRPAVQAMAASISGYRGGGDPGKLMDLLHVSDPRVIAAASLALGRMRYGYALLTLERLFSHEAIIVREAAILAALLLGSRTAEDHCRRLCEQRQTGTARPAFFLALCGRLNDVTLFVPSGTRAIADPQNIEAAGILGNVQAVPFLLRMLTGEEAVKMAAAEALDLITGAGLREKVVVTEKIDLLGGEFAETKREVERVCTRPRMWEGWWYDHRARLTPSQRWRRGRPFDVGQCLAELNDPRSRFHERQRAGWELAIQARPNIRFEPDWFVAQQQNALQEWANWWSANGRVPL